MRDGRERWDYLGKHSLPHTCLAQASLLQKLFCPNYSSPSGPKLLTSHFRVLVDPVNGKPAVMGSIRASLGELGYLGEILGTKVRPDQGDPIAPDNGLSFVVSWSVS